MRVSYSSLETFNRCPLQYKYRYVDGIKTPDKPELFFGGLIHKIVQEALRRDPALPSLDELLASFKNQWRPELFASEQNEKAMFEEGVKMIRNFYQDHQPGLRNIVAIEKRFQMPLGEHILSGAIDRIDKLPHGPFEVIDYKTDKKMPSQQDIDSLDRYQMQLGIYHLATEYSWPDAKDIKLTLYFLKYQQKMTTHRPQQVLGEIKEKIVKTADEIVKTTNKGEFKPTAGSHCSWCDYNDICPLTKHKYQRSEVGDQNSDIRSPESDLRTLIDEYLQAHEKMSILEPKIHSHFDRQKIERFYHKKGTVSRTGNKIRVLKGK